MHQSPATPWHPADEQILDLAVSLGLPFRVLPDDACDAFGLPHGTRQLGSVTTEQLVAFARAVIAQSGGAA